MSTDERTISRNEMYEILWTKPLKAVEKELRLKSAHLVWLCDRHRIPRPPTGYWTLAKCGKAPTRRLLPACDILELKTVHLPPLYHELPSVPQLDADILERIECAKQKSFPVKAEPHDLHPMVEATRRALEMAKANDRHLLSSFEFRDKRALNAVISADSIPRALCFLDALVRGVVAVGGAIKTVVDGRKFDTEVRIGKERAGSVGIQERWSLKKRDKRKPAMPWTSTSEWDRVPNGRLVVTYGDGVSGCWCDDSENGKKKIEDQLSDLIVHLIESVGRHRIYRREEPERRRIQEEQDRLAKENGTEVMRQQIELSLRHNDERNRVNRLLTDAEAWRQARRLRQYIAAVRESLIEKHGTIETGSEHEQWLKWAGEQADRRDPLASKPASSLNEPLLKSRE